MEDSTSKADFGSLSENEVILARSLLAKRKISGMQFAQFIQLRNRFDNEGKRYLGDILVGRGDLSKETLDEFFTKNNAAYLEFCHQLLDQGFLRRDHHDRIMADERSANNVISVIEDLGIMTKESFTKLFGNKSGAIRLGDWLVENKKVTKEKLQDALAEQTLNNLEGYLVYHKIVDRETIDEFKEELNLL